MANNNQFTSQIALDACFDSRCIPEPNSGCLIWLGTINADGYGVVKRAGKFVLAHRCAWAKEHGNIPSGKIITHSCDVPLCCNVRHLSVGTQADNLADCLRKGRRKNNEKAKEEPERAGKYRVGSASAISPGA